jgi:hypothetical protein
MTGRIRGHSIGGSLKSYGAGRAEKDSVTYFWEIIAND